MPIKLKKIMVLWPLILFFSHSASGGCGVFALSTNSDWDWISTAKFKISKKVREHHAYDELDADVEELLQLKNPRVSPSENPMGKEYFQFFTRFTNDPETMYKIVFEVLSKGKEILIRFVGEATAYELSDAYRAVGQKGRWIKLKGVNLKLWASPEAIGKAQLKHGMTHKEIELLELQVIRGQPLLELRSQHTRSSQKIYWLVVNVDNQRYYKIVYEIKDNGAHHMKTMFPAEKRLWDAYQRANSF